MQFKLTDKFTSVIMEIECDRLHPGLICVTRVIYIASIYLIKGEITWS